MNSLVVALVGVGLSASALAQCSGKAEGATAKGTCDKSAKLAAGKDGATCAKNMAGVPKLTCKVGDKTVNCPMEAAKLAKANDETITYVVAGKEYTDRTEAAQAYTKELNRRLEQLTTVQYNVGDKAVNCPKAAEAMATESGKPVQFRVASYTFANQTDAEQAATAAREAADNVSMKVMVDGKEVECEKGAKAGKCCAKGEGATAKCCDKDGAKLTATAGKTCDKDSAKAQTVAAKDAKGDGCCKAKAGEATAQAGDREFVIGDMKTCCPDMAQIQFAMAKVQAATQALEQVVARNGQAKEVAQAD
jgi:hypothetical protein